VCVGLGYLAHSPLFSLLILFLHLYYWNVVLESSFGFGRDEASGGWCFSNSFELCST
jgi:hypothetical protein